MTAERDLRAQLRLLCAELRRTSGCSAAAVILMDPAHGTIDAIESNGLPLAVDTQWQQAVRAAPAGTEADVLPADLVPDCAVPLLVGDERLGVVLTFRSDPGDRAGEAVVVEHYVQDLPKPLVEAARAEAGLAVPVWWQGQLMGVFGVLAEDRSRLFNAQDREVMELLANHVAIAIENARLYGEVRDRLAEVTGLQAASAALAEELLPERALRVLAQQALSLSGAATVSIELLREGGRELEVQVAVGEHALELASMRVPVDGSLAGTAVSTGRAQIVRPPSPDGSRNERSTPAERTSARSLLVL